MFVKFTGEAREITIQDVLSVNCCLGWRHAACPVGQLTLV